MLAKIFNPFLYVIKEKKKLIASMVLMTFLFGILIFPLDDLRDVITQMVLDGSNQKIFVQFDQMGIGFLPPSLKLLNVSVDPVTLAVPTIKAKKLYLAPNIAALLTFNPGFSASLEDVMKGDIEIDMRPGKKVSDKVKMQNVGLNMKSIDLKTLTSLSQTQMDIDGSLGASLDAQVDLTFAEQPDGTFTIEINKLKPSAIPTMMGPMYLPNVEISNITLKGELKGGNFEITDGVVGKQGEPISGLIKGRMAMKFRATEDGQVIPEFGAYEFKFDLVFDSQTEKNFSLFLNFLDKSFRTVTGTGSRYAFRINAPSLQMAPTISPRGSW